MPKIDTEQDQFIEFRLTKNNLEMMVHAEKFEAVAIGGVGMTTMLEAYFKMIDDLKLPHEEIFKVLLPQLEESLNKLGAGIKIVKEE